MIVIVEASNVSKTGQPRPDPPTPPSTPLSTEPITMATGREVAPGGWRRAVTGVVVGLAAGLVHRTARHLDEVRQGRP